MIHKYLLIVIFISFFISAQSQIDTLNNKKEKIKSGWNFGALPVVSYNTDLGFQYGGLINLFDYGDGNIYPDYKHSIYLEISRYTKGSGIYKLTYDSEYLLPGFRTISRLSYYPDMAVDFFGFNGYETRYNKDWADDKSDTYKSRVFYNHKRNRFVFEFDLQHQMFSSKLKWLAGVAFYHFDLGTVDIDKLNKGKSDSDKLPDTELLYDKYLRWGIISEKESEGGWCPFLRLGAVYDTRDIKANPMKGIWSEAILAVSPGNFSNGNFAHSKLSLIHRQYFTLLPKRLSFAYRLQVDALIAGKLPFYLYPFMLNSNIHKTNQEGLGGAKSVRGVIRNRAQGEGTFLGNFELRWKIARFIIKNQNFYIALSSFYDVGKVIQERNIDTENLRNTIMYQGENSADYLPKRPEDFHSSYGFGLHIAMNQNFIVACDYGRALDIQDGEQGLYIGLNFLF